MKEAAESCNVVEDLEQSIAALEESTDRDNAMEEDRDSSSDVEYGDHEDYPGDDQPRPAL